MPKLVPNSYEFIVCSGGGSGTTMLLDFFSQNHCVNSPKDYDNLKHLPIPPVSFNKNMKCIFVYSNPVDVCISIFNRGYHYWQSRKLSRFSSSSNIIPQDSSLEEYADIGKDLLGLENQFKSYYEQYILYPTLFLKYESIWDNLGIIQNFLNLTDNEISKFPQKHNRTSYQKICSEETYSLLSKGCYKNFLDWIELLPSAQIRQPRSKSLFARVIASKNFRLALLNGISSLFGKRLVVYGERYFYA
jgi:hypothetical protein